MAKPKLGSTKRAANVVNAPINNRVSAADCPSTPSEHSPETGMKVAISPNAIITEYTSVPTKAYAMSVPAGPEVASAPPDPMKRPVPSAPPIAIICKCLDCSLRWR